MIEIDYLITGSNGLLGQKIVSELQRKGLTFIGTSKGKNRNPSLKKENYLSLDLTDQKSFNEVLEVILPKFVINTAALTNVDLCEDQRELCDALNVTAVQWLLDFSEKRNAKLVHISTDFVFDGENGPYVESDVPNPLSYYGKSKFLSEKILEKSSYKNWAIARTIIVFGTAAELSRSNIVLWAMDALVKGGEMNIVNDQFRSPTFAEDLAIGCLLICEKDQTGLFHLSGEKTYSIYDFVLAIGDYLKVDPKNVKAISSINLNQKAHRPPKTGFDISKAKLELGFNPRSLEEALTILEKQLKA
jgi:dTDP-4-dehydrorhamnose reductase